MNVHTRILPEGNTVELLNWYLISVNTLTVFLFGLDKIKAVKGKYRIPERVLFLFMAAGGGLGSVLGMFLFRHKTKKKRFVYGGIAALAVQAALYIWIVGHLPVFQI